MLVMRGKRLMGFWGVCTGLGGRRGICGMVRFPPFLSFLFTPWSVTILYAQMTKKKLANISFSGPNNFVPIYGSKEAAQHAWVNLNRFFAHISHQQRLTPIPQLKDWIEDYGLWNISDGLEVADLEAIKENGESAAVWLEIAGRDIYKDEKWGKRDGRPEEGIPKRGNELWDKYLEEGGVYEKRWDFWRQRLLEIAGEEGLEKQIREAAEKAARVMGEIEGGS
jgi:hypothetical protein